MKSIRQESRFKKDIKLHLKRGKRLEKLQAVILELMAEHPLPPKNKDHVLTGNWNGWRECHIEPDWLLIYKITPDELLLARTGTHSDLFG